MTATSPKGAAGRLRLRVTATAESVLRSGHPWLFAESIRAQNRNGELGELAVVYDRKDTFLAVGLFDPESPIRVRILHAGKPMTIDAAWWRGRLEQAFASREKLFSNSGQMAVGGGGPATQLPTTGYRCINGESDGWPGLVLDRYDTTFVLKLYSAVWLPRLEETVDLLQARASGVRVVLRLSRNIQEISSARFNKSDGQILCGPDLSSPVVFLETGLRFEADVLRGQKTGFFLDQRENRRQVETLARGRAVLNAFSFSGGFSLYAARGAARSVTDLDISPHALSASRRNFSLNEALPSVARCPHEFIQADVFGWLEQSAERRFDLVVLDPPSLAKREAERAGAIHAYGRLAAMGIRALNRGGVLVAASCSAHVTAAEFFGAVRESAVKSRRKFSELLTTGHAADHLATFKEGQYLKAIYLGLE
jgi:23S rRNA (cytosine1962-C5)-methyltransferase